MYARTAAPRLSSTVAVVGVLGITTYAGLVSWAAGRTTYDTWGGLVVIPLLLLISVPMLVRAGRRDPDPRFLRLLAWAFALKGLATVARYLMAFALYDGVADAATYDKEGERLAESYRHGDFGADIGRPFVGTGFVRVTTGAIYAVTGPSVFIAYAVFSWLGFWGLYLLYRAFRVAVPDGDAHRYAVLVLFLPSMLFWPSGLGKEALMTLGIGLVAYGSALLLTEHRRWPVPLLGGLLLTGCVRPHITAALFLGVAVAVVLGRKPSPATVLTPIGRLLAVAAISVGGVIAVSQAADFLKIDEVSVSSVDEAISDTNQRTSTGGSIYDAQGVERVADFPVAAFSVVFRPLPFEAANPQMMLAALEGVVLLLLVAGAFGSMRFRGLGGRLRRQPYLLLCLVYSVAFIYAFSNFANFGIVTRERVQVLPFVLVFLALPAATRSGRAQPRSRTRQGITS